MDISNKDIAINALIAAAYSVLTIVISPISYGPIQVRVTELMVLFCFFNKRYAIGLTLGCLLANLASPMALLDVPFGTLATLLACIGIMFSPYLIVAIIWPVLFNAFIVAGVLTSVGEPYWMSVLTVGAGELIVMVASYIIFMLLKRNKKFFDVIGARQHIDFKF